MIVSIQKADYLGEYKINFSFSDGANRTIDFSNFLKESKNPMTQKYLDKKLFQSYSLAYGDVLWNDYELCFPTWSLHEGLV